MPPAKNAITNKPSPLRRLVLSARDVALVVPRIVLRDPLSAFLLLASIALAITFFSMLGSLKPKSPGSEVPLSAIGKLADSNRVSEGMLLDEDARVVVNTKSGFTFWAAYPHSDTQTQALLRRLERNGAAVTVDQQAGKPTRQIVVQFLLPILLLVCLFALFMRAGQDGGAGGIASFSDSGAKGSKRRKRGKQDPNRVTFASIAGVPEALAELEEIRDYLDDPSKYLALGAGAPKGVLLVGPPGTGKTLLARAVAGEADASFFSMSGSDFVESLVGVGAARVRDLFRKARKVAPSIIFIDELDAAGRKRGAGVGQGNDEREQTLNQILVEMDGFGGDAGIVVMGATNRPDILDPALLRPGRFDRQVTVDTPDVHGRRAILELHARKRPLGPDSDLGQIARLTPGFSGAELANVINEAALLTVREGSTVIGQATLEEAIDRVVAGPAKKHILTEDERWVIAIHEAAHAVVTRSIGQRIATQKLSIVARAAGRHRRRGARVRLSVDGRPRRPARGDCACALDGCRLWHVARARPDDGRREAGRGLPRRLAGLAELDGAVDAGDDRPRGRAHRQRGRAPVDGGAPAQLGRRAGDRGSAARPGDAVGGRARGRPVDGRRDADRAGRQRRGPRVGIGG